MFTADLSPLDIEILVLPESTLILTAAVLEPLRAANRVLGRRQFSWTISTPDGRPAVTTSGIPIPADRAFAPSAGGAPLMVVASYNIDRHATPDLLRRIGAARRTRSAIGGVESGALVLARAGLLNGRAATAHWEDLDDFSANHPEIDVRPHRFVIDGPRFTAGGASPTLDMMLELIRRRHGYPLALEVSKLFIYDPARVPAQDQPQTLGRLIGGDPRVSASVQAMEAHLEDPISIADAASAAGVSARRLQTLFKAALGVTPKAYYLALRLNLARRQVIETPRRIADIAASAGFNYLSVFTRAYSARFGETPSQTRARARRDSGLAIAR
jgi:AraC family transcriptional regulator, glycine betaine-responsive activator